MTADCLGNPVTNASPNTLQGIDDFILGFLSYTPRAVNILAAAEAAPDCCLANAYAAMIWMFLEAPEAAERASPRDQRSGGRRGGRTAVRRAGPGHGGTGRPKSCP